MFRTLTVAAVCLFAVPALAETKDEKAGRCAIQSGIVEAAIEHRTANRSENSATRKILRSAPIKGSKYEANVDVLVAWIYSVPDAHLTAETVTTFEQACLDYQQ